MEAQLAEGRRRADLELSGAPVCGSIGRGVGSAAWRGAPGGRREQDRMSVVEAVRRQSTWSDH